MKPPATPREDGKGGGMPKDGDARAEPADAPVHALAHEFIAAGDPTGWFEPLYASVARDIESGAEDVPWVRRQPSPLLQAWLSEEDVVGEGRRAIVVGCGLGDDAELLAARGFAVTAFDIAPSAIAWCRRRWPASRVDYRVADLFDVPAEWAEAFDLVVEIRTVQALPVHLRDDVMAAIAGLVAPGGTLVAVGHLCDGPCARTGPPWPLTRGELAQFEAAGLTAVEHTEHGTDAPNAEHATEVRAVFSRPA